MSARVVVGILVFLLTAELRGQVDGDVVISVQRTHLIPVSSLRDLFVSTGGFSLTAGQRTESAWAWEGIIELARFSKSNAERLHYPDLTLKLDLYGGGVRASYYPFELQGVFSGLLHPYISGGISAYRWFYERGSYTIDTTRQDAVPELKQQDWSLGFRVGTGVEVLPTTNVAVTGQVSYNAVVGEIWPTLALRIDGVSVFQMAEVFVGIKYYFGR
jgi:hypothetical protein